MHAKFIELFNNLELLGFICIFIKHHPGINKFVHATAVNGIEIVELIVQT